ncbi:Sec-independent protein translocase subunit TatA/TatB [Anaerocolumna sp. MB42-C2]|uniref:Sec-independent protein translocase subunit TatA/TatB n=1 Tax=Anaerocolumna sp. MB42-C2 TaxID=3070997 RepID=UPI0027E0169C|nr:twin-arginine translocase TatA/TatE family subunit [Anaerocolumna sp. MB42-C2]WMJ85534.1 twin-arginine translocase TatA/TatE family subunit [Anaerocolumna sp. MB42-C2]
MSRIGTNELLLIFAVALIVFGPSRLPVLGKFAGKTLGQLKGYVDKMTSEFEEMDADGSNNPKESPQKTSTVTAAQTQDDNE